MMLVCLEYECMIWSFHSD